MVQDMATMASKSEDGLSADTTVINATSNIASDPSDISVTPREEQPSQPQPLPKASSSSPPSANNARRTKLEITLVMAALCIALFLAALDMTIVTTAVPTISAHFHSASGFVWIGSAYMLGSAAPMPIWGKLSDIFGRKPLLMTAVVIFWIGSLLCAVSTTMPMLIAARAVQGVGGGGTIVLPNICVADLFSARKRGVYFGLLSMIWAFASAIGPIIGGAFTARVSWRWCFYINLPCAGIALLILLFFLKLHNPRTPMKDGLVAIDWVGNLLVVGGTVMLLLGLELGGAQLPWRSATVICLIVFGIAAIVVFFFYEAHMAKFPVVPARLFKSRTNVATYLTSALHAFTFISGSYYLPLYFQAVVGANSLLSGVYLLPFVATMSLVSAVAGVFINKTGNYKIIISGGLVLSTLGFGLFTYLGHRPHWVRIVLFQLVAGIGIGPNFQAPLIAVQSNAEPKDIGAVTSSLQFLRQLSIAVSIAVGGVVFTNRIQMQQGMLVAELGQQTAGLFAGTEAASNVDRIETLPVESRQTVRKAYWNALQIMFAVFTASSFLGLLVSFAIRQKTLSRHHTEHLTGLQTLEAEERTKKAGNGKDVEMGQ